MGTHPIFESDFDCLTEIVTMIGRLKYFSLLIGLFGAIGANEFDEKTKQMLDWQRKAGQEQTIKLNKSDFKKYVQSKSEYYTVVMFTAMLSERGCAICKEAAAEYHILANSIRYTGSQSDLGKVFFVTVDYDQHQGGDIFNQMKLSTAPAFYIFPPSKEDKLDVQAVGYQAESMAKWLKDRSDVVIRVYRPPNHSGTGFLILMTLFAIGMIYMKWDVMSEFLNRDTISWVLISACLAFISGQVWNSIRGPQYLMRARGGGIGFVYPSSQHQLIAETHIVLILYGMMTGGVIILSKGTQPSDEPGKWMSLMLTGAALLAIGYGLMLNIFKRKYHGYPYSFFLG